MPFRNKACLCHRLFIPGNAVALFASLVLLSSTNADEKSKPKSAAKASAAGQAEVNIYLPENASEKPLPLVVHIHGGGWKGGSKFPCPVVAMVNRGYVVASIEYRFSQKALFPAQIQDCQAAIRWLRANAKAYNIDTEHVGVDGGSAGGHLSALVATAGGKNAFSKIGGNDDNTRKPLLKF